MILDTRLPLLIPAWPAPANVKSYSTLRYPGESAGVYNAFNLALHVGDNPEQVRNNRCDLRRHAHLPSEPKWLSQTHSDIALCAEIIDENNFPVADASFTQKANLVCVVMTADCLPILVTNTQGTEVAAIHAGWQGLAKGVVENTLVKLKSKPEDLLIWIGPSIQQVNYEVGEDFYAAFARNHSLREMQEAFVTQKNKKWLANVPLLAVQRLKSVGISETNIYLSQECTYANPEKYFSYRRDAVTGRMASFIWIS